MKDKPLILIADDETDIRDVVKMKLEASGFKVEGAADGEEAVQKAKELVPDLIILDVVMPKMDGVSALFKLKEDEKTKGIKVFLFTGKGDPRPDIVEVNKKFALESGAVGFIRKEVDLDELVVKLNEAIKQNGK
ncbi:MAG: response regulator [Candidatus Wolfebacteria bacterium]|nr:response regulator [Candidatus Wolfebacteria bacterium]